LDLQSIKNTILDYTYRIIEVKLNTGTETFSVFVFYAPEEGRIKVNDKICAQLQEMLKLTKMITSYSLET
jgi:hypothetical protein